jgi:DNA primase
MLEPILTPRDIAERYHRFLPEEIRRYLNSRGIPNALIDRQLLGWNGKRVTLPVFGWDGDVLSLRYARSPADKSDSPKVVSDPGATVELYGWETLARNPRRVVICEGEFDRLVLEARGFPAVTSTGGAATFPGEWVSHLTSIPEIFICFDRDAAGEAGAKKVKRVLPRAHIVRLPAEVGDGGDITDYFVRLRKSPASFEKLLAAGAAEAGQVATDGQQLTGQSPKQHKSVSSRAKRLKASVPIERVIARYIELRPSGSKLVGLCPFHADRQPSFTVYPETSTYYCFGCGAHGDVITFLMHKESLTFGQALEALERFLYTHELFPNQS